MNTKLKQAIQYNALLLVMLTGIIVLYLLDQELLVILTSIAWGILVITGNYNILTKEHDIVKYVLKYNREHDNLFHDYLRQMELNVKAEIAKAPYFNKQPESIQRAYDLIIKKQESYFEIIFEYMRQYDYVTKPRSSEARELAEKSNQLHEKFLELCEDCYAINSASSTVDISIIDDLLASLDEMQQTD